MIVAFYSCAEFIISRQASSASSQVRSVSKTQSVVKIKKIKHLHEMKNHLNMHIDLHYVKQIKEYTIANNCNVLAEEDKHQNYKRLVTQTNHQNVEKILLLQKFFQHTLQLVLNKVFEESELKLEHQIQHLYRDCSAVLNNFLRLNFCNAVKNIILNIIDLNDNQLLKSDVHKAVSV